MQSKARLFGHPIHPMLIVFPLGLLLTGTLFDIIHVVTGATGWTLASVYMIGAGIIGALVAAVFGLIDVISIPSGTRAQRVAWVHGVGNVVVVVLYIVSFLIRLGQPAVPSAFAVVLSIAGAALLLVTGWLGGELVNRLGVSVDEGANVNAPSSLSRKPAGPAEPPERMAAD
jgi:uncharacterized membrane protein